MKTTPRREKKKMKTIRFKFQRQPKTKRKKEGKKEKRKKKKKVTLIKEQTHFLSTFLSIFLAKLERTFFS